YVATVTVTPKAGYTLTGVGANSMTATGAMVTHGAGSGATLAVTANFMQTMALVPSSNITKVPLGPGTLNGVGPYSGIEKVINSPGVAGNEQVPSYYIGSTEVTFGLWHSVRTWAEGRTTNRYWFQNAGREGHDGGIGAAPTVASNEPVTTVSWRDVVVWTNAYSEMVGLTPVYRDAANSGTILRDSRNGTAGDGVTNAVRLEGANGYRLPTGVEWEMAARWLGTSAAIPGVSGTVTSPVTTTEGGVTYFWTPASYGSGALNGTDAEFDRVSWNSRTSGSMTKDVGGKPANTLGMRDVTGNVWEWVWGIGGVSVETKSAIRGGGWASDSTSLPVSYVYPYAPTYTNYNVGFRLSRTGN
ncbi:MAG: SUMF1/EgtB/PvdO family nonheme iron enzyme, partial [Paenibacillaceae bacterium]|nr:SUMF1/EgtB/PvdO family nonheme iron enzyme [Paenibacillaceae bacterium]